MFRAAYRSLSGALNCICSLWFIYPCGDRPLSRLGGKTFPTQPRQRPVTTWVYNPEAAYTVWSSWWELCGSKHVEPSIKFGIINSITRLHLVRCFYWLMFKYCGRVFICVQCFIPGLRFHFMGVVCEDKQRSFFKVLSEEGNGIFPPKCWWISRRLHGVITRQVKVKVKCTLVQVLRLCTGRTAHRGSSGIALLFHDHGTRRCEGSASRPSRSLPPGKTRYPLYRRMGGPQGRSGQVRKISPPPGLDPRTV